MKRRVFLKTAAMVPALGCVLLPAIAQPETITVSPALPIGIGGDWILHVRQDRYIENPRVFVPKDFGVGKMYEAGEVKGWLYWNYGVFPTNKNNFMLFHESEDLESETNRIHQLRWALEMKGAVIDLDEKLFYDRDLYQGLTLHNTVNYIFQQLLNYDHSVIVNDRAEKLQIGCSREIEVRRCERNIFS